MNLVVAGGPATPFHRQAGPGTTTRNADGDEKPDDGPLGQRGAFRTAALSRRRATGGAPQHGKDRGHAQASPNPGPRAKSYGRTTAVGETRLDAGSVIHTTNPLQQVFGESNERTPMRCLIEHGTNPLVEGTLVSGWQCDSRQENRRTACFSVLQHPMSPRGVAQGKAPPRLDAKRAVSNRTKETVGDRADFSRA